MVCGVRAPCCRALLVVIAWSFSGGVTAMAQEGDAVRMNVLDAARDLLGTERGTVGREWSSSIALAPSDGDSRGGSAHIDLSPAVDEIFGFLHRHGVPLQEQLDEHGKGPIGVYADFHVSPDAPPVKFHLGDRSPEPIGAFYSSHHGFRCAVVWPVDRFTLRLEAGDDSELGYFGIAGVQWVDPHRPLAIGLGVPMNLNGANGSVGFVVQLRMKLN